MVDDVQGILDGVVVAFRELVSLFVAQLRETQNQIEVRNRFGNLSVMFADRQVVKSGDVKIPLLYSSKYRVSKYRA